MLLVGAHQVSSVCSTISLNAIDSDVEQKSGKRKVTCSPFDDCFFSTNRKLSTLNCETKTSSPQQLKIQNCLCQWT